MNDWWAATCLLSGAIISLLAAVGVLRLPDVFMRMHAATKSGVVGCGLILLSVALVDGGVGTAVKVTIAILFLLLTTPVAGHLLGRAAYVSGAPLWRGTLANQLEPILPRGQFGPSRSRRSAVATSSTDVGSAEGVKQVNIALARGPHIGAAIGEAISLARRHDALLCGVAIIDEPRLFNVGPIPIRGGHHATELREWRLTKARQAAADVIQAFESQTRDAGVQCMVRVEEGRPQTILRALQLPGHVVAVAPGGWFDQGVLDRDFHTVRRLVHMGVHPLLVLGIAPAGLERIRFIHDGSIRSWETWRWLLHADLWPEAMLIVSVPPGTETVVVEQAIQRARKRGRQAEPATNFGNPDEYLVIGNADSQSWLPRWFDRRRSVGDAKVIAVG